MQSRMLRLAKTERSFTDEDEVKPPRVFAIVELSRSRNAASSEANEEPNSDPSTAIQDAPEICVQAGMLIVQNPFC
jgi:hypothetical protein